MYVRLGRKGRTSLKEEVQWKCPRIFISIGGAVLSHSPLGCGELHFNGLIPLHHSDKYLSEQLAIHQHCGNTNVDALGLKREARRGERNGEREEEREDSPFTSVMET